MDGKRLPTLEEYSHLLLPPDVPQDHIAVSPLNLVNDEPNAWLPIDVGNGTWAALPGPEFCPRLYRGQSRLYQSCKPSIFRDGLILKYLANVAKLLEFYSYLEASPGVHILNNHEIRGCKGKVNYELQAQHYGVASTILDFSRSRDIAEFFARCRPTPSTSDEVSWEAIPQREFHGVLFTVDLAKIFRSEFYRDALALSSPSPFLRPHRQKAVGLQLISEDLAHTPFVTQENLAYSDRRVSELLETYARGEFLFPDDVMSRISQRLCDTNAIRCEALEATTVVTDSPQPTERLAASLERLGYDCTRRIGLMTAGEAQELEQEWIVASEELKRSMRVRLTANHQLVASETGGNRTEF